MPSALDRARTMWTELARAEVAFPGPGEARVVVSAESLLCPAGWVGIVVLDGAALATVPSQSLVEPVRTTLGGEGTDGVPDLDRLQAVLRAEEVLGPAALAYLDRADFVAADRHGVWIDRLTGGPDELTALLAGVDEAEADESGLGGITSDAFVIRDGPRMVAAAGYRLWPSDVAHLLLLTAPAYRGRGLALLVASAATAAALDAGLVPQWRARPEASRRTARSLGFREYGSQLSALLRVDREPAGW